jgi:DNA-dependent RNA polymerase auxiliary subunit epsilon
MLIKDEVEEIKKEYDFIDMIEDVGLDFEKENF